MVMEKSLQLYDGTASALASINRLLSVTNSQMRGMGEQTNAASMQQEQFNKKLQNASSYTSTLSKRIKKIKDAMDKLSGRMGFVDEVSQTNARLNIMNDGLQSAAQLQDMVYAAAQRSRTAYMQTADMVGKLGQRAGNAFSSSAETVAFAEQMNKQFALAGTSQDKAAAATSKLTQALGTGVLRSEDFNTLMETAPNAIQTVAAYMGKPVDAVRDLATQGQLSAEVFKNALLSATAETDAKLAAMPMTWGQVWTMFSNFAINAFTPLLEKITEFASSEQFQAFATSAADALVGVGDIAAQAFDWIVSGLNWLMENINVVAPLFFGLAAAVGVYSLAVTMAKIAQDGINSSILKSPVFWIAAVIGIVIGVIAKWIGAVGGVQVAWLILQRNAMWVMDTIRIKGMEIWNFICTIGENLNLWFQKIGVGFSTGLRTHCANALKSIQDFINAAIGGINRFIEVLNNIPGVSIQAIGGVTFGAEAQVLAEQKNAAEQAALEKTDEANKQAQAEREMNIWKAQGAMQTQQTILNGKIDSAQASNASNAWMGDVPNTFDASPYGNMPLGDMMGGGTSGANSVSYDPAQDINTTAENTGQMAQTMEIAEEDLSYLRDMAEQEAINRFTTAEVKLEMVNNNTISGTQDIDGIVDYFGDRLSEMMVVAAEGGHA